MTDEHPAPDVEPILELELRTAEPGVWAVRSDSATVYLVDTRSPDFRMARVTDANSDSRGDFDKTWQTLVGLDAGPQISPDGVRAEGSVTTAWVVGVGSRHEWTFDPGPHWPAYHWWISRRCLAIEQLDDEAAAALLQARDAEN